MTEEEYKEKLRELVTQHKAKVNLLGKEFAWSQNPYKVGDILTDHRCTIRFERLKYSFNYLGEPQCVYWGPRLTKKGIPFKSGEQDYIYHSNIKET